jgi:hypothetical protein
MICAAAELTDQDPLRLSFIAALVNPRRLGRSNPQEAKPSHTYPRKRADRTPRPPPSGHLTLGLLPLPLRV